MTQNHQPRHRCGRDISPARGPHVGLRSAVFTLVAAIALLGMIPGLAMAGPQTGRDSATDDGKTRTTPLTIGSTGRVDDYDIKVLDVTPDATDLIMASNQFNDAPADGHQFFMAKVSVTYRGDETGNPAFDLNFQAVGSSAVGYSTFNDSCGAVPDDAFAIAGSDLFSGGTVEFNVCWAIASRDAGSLVMYVDPLVSFDDEPVWFSLGNDGAGGTEGRATPGTSSSPSATTTTPKNDRDNPLPIGTPGTVGDYTISVVSVTPDATDMVLAENSFNDKPAAGEQFFIARVALTYNGDETGSALFDLQFEAVGDSSVGYTTFDNSCGVVPDDPIDASSDLFPGGTVEVNECWTIRTSDADSLVMYVEPLLSFDDAQPVWFALND